MIESLLIVESLVTQQQKCTLTKNNPRVHLSWTTLSPDNLERLPQL